MALLKWSKMVSLFILQRLSDPLDSKASAMPTVVSPKPSDLSAGMFFKSAPNRSILDLFHMVGGQNEASHVFLL